MRGGAQARRARKRKKQEEVAVAVLQLLTWELLTWDIMHYHWMMKMARIWKPKKDEPLRKDDDGWHEVENAKKLKWDAKKIQNAYDKDYNQPETGVFS